MASSTAWARAVAMLGSVLRLLQSGNIRSYATWVLFGSVALILAMGLFGGLPR